jgi:hypothetical protein
VCQSKTSPAGIGKVATTTAASALIAPSAQ